MGKYVTKSINTYLLLILIGILVFGSMFAVYYQQVFGTTKEGYSECRQELTSCTTQLVNTLTNLSIRGEDVSRYSTLYEEQGQQLSSTQADLASKSAELDAKKNELANANKEIDKLKGKVATLNQTINTLEVQIENLEDDLDSCNAELNACRNP